MESKKINQLATSVSPQTSDLTIIGDPTTGVSKKITLLQIANLFATTGTVSSVAVTETGDALTITGSPITSTGTINIGFAGDATQYVRGDGALADFPTSTGGGSSVSYYLNSSVSQGTIGGVAYRELSKDPISGAGTDITISANGYVASYITDANDPALLEVPGGNFNCEFYFSVNSNAHNPYVYAELYKYDGTTFTLLGSSQSVPEYLTNGTTLSPYYFAIPVSVAALTITDRLAIRIYVNVDTKIVTLHTENNHLCQVVTTFSKGLISLNNLTRQNQFFGTGTSGTDFAISSSTATHTFNLPVASATNTGKLSSTDWSTFNGKVPYTGATADVDLGTNQLTSGNAKINDTLYLKVATTYAHVSGYYGIQVGTNIFVITNSASTQAVFSLASLTTSRTFTLPDASGTLALTSDLTNYVTLGTSQNISGIKTFSVYPLFDAGIFIKHGTNISAGGYTGIGATTTGLILGLAAGGSGSLIFNTSSNYQYTFPSATGTLALTSDLSAYLPLAGGTLTGALSGTSATFTSSSFPLDIYGTTNNYGLRINNVQAATLFLYSSNANADNRNWGLFTNSEVFGDFDIRQSNAINGDLTNGANSTSRLYIKNNGNVGIGTSSPSYLLDVVKAGTNAIRVQNTANTTDAYFIAQNTGGSAFFGINATGPYIYTAAALDFTLITNNVERMRITSGGNVSIGSTVDTGFRTFIKGTNGVLISAGSSSSNNAFYIQNEAENTNLFIVRGDGAIYTGTAANSPYNLTTGSGANVFVESGGLLYRSTSSLKYKKEVRDYDKGLAEVMSMRPVYYKGKGENDGNTQFAGLIAEEVHELGLTEFVQYAKDGSPDALAYANMVALLTKAIQELKAEIDELKNK